MGRLIRFVWLILVIGISAAGEYGLGAPQAGGNGTFRGYVRTALIPGGIVENLGNCRVLVLNTGAPGLMVGQPISSTDTVKGPAVLFADFNTPSTGYYEVHLPAGDYKVIFWAAGFVPRTYDLTIRPGINEPVFSYYEKEERPIRPGTGIDPWTGGPTHDFLSFDRTVRSAAPAPPTGKTPPEEPGEFRITGKTYTDLKYGFALDAPSADWNILGGAAAAGEVKNARAFFTNTDKTAALSLMAGTNRNKAMPQTILDAFSGAMGDHDVVERKSVTIGPYQGVVQTQMSRPAKPEEPKVYYMVAVFGDERFLCIIAGWTAASLQDSHSPKFLHIINSFRRIDP